MVVRLFTGCFEPGKDYLPIAPQNATPARAPNGKGRRGMMPGRPWHGSAGRRGRPVTADDQLKESPQAQEPEALGLSIVKPCFSIESTKSMVAPVR